MFCSIEIKHCIKLGKRRKPLTEAKSEKIKVGDVDIQVETIKTKSGTTELMVFAATPEDSSNSCLDVAKRITSDNDGNKQLILDLTLKNSLITESQKPKSITVVKSMPKLQMIKSKSASLLKVNKSGSVKGKTIKSKSNKAVYGSATIKYFGEIIPKSAGNLQTVTLERKSGSGKKSFTKSLGKMPLITGTVKSLGKTGFTSKSKQKSKQKSDYLIESKKLVRIKSAASVRSSKHCE